MRDVATGLLIGVSVACFAVAGYVYRLYKENKAYESTGGM